MAEDHTDDTQDNSRKRIHDKGNGKPETSLHRKRISHNTRALDISKPITAEFMIVSPPTRSQTTELELILSPRAQTTCSTVMRKRFVIGVQLSKLQTRIMKAFIEDYFETKSLNATNVIKRVRLLVNHPLAFANLMEKRRGASFGNTDLSDLDNARVAAVEWQSPTQVVQNESMQEANFISTASTTTLL